MQRELKSRTQKVTAWTACATLSKTWLAFLDTVPKNKAMTDREWFAAFRVYASAHANPPSITKEKV